LGLVLQPIRHSTAALVPIPRVAIPIIVLFWPKARSVNSEVRQTFTTFLEALFKVTELAAGANNDLGSCQ